MQINPNNHKLFSIAKWMSDVIWGNNKHDRDKKMKQRLKANGGDSGTLLPDISSV